MGRDHFVFKKKKKNRPFSFPLREDLLKDEWSIFPQEVSSLMEDRTFYPSKHRTVLSNKETFKKSRQESKTEDRLPMRKSYFFHEDFLVRKELPCGLSQKGIENKKNNFFRKKHTP